MDCHFLLQGNLPDPGIKPRSPTLQAAALLSEPSGVGINISTPLPHVETLSEPQLSSGLPCPPPHIRMLKSQPLVPQDETLFGSKVMADVNIEDEG